MDGARRMRLRGRLRGFERRMQKRDGPRSAEAAPNLASVPHRESLALSHGGRLSTRPATASGELASQFGHPGHFELFAWPTRRLLSYSVDRYDCDARRQGGQLSPVWFRDSRGGPARTRRVSGSNRQAEVRATPPRGCSLAWGRASLLHLADHFACLRTAASAERTFALFGSSRSTVSYSWIASARRPNACHTTPRLA